MFRRLELLIGSDLQKLEKSKVIIFGVGGVGGYVAEMLTRSGMGNLTIVDYDVVDISNKNRQIIALDSTIGKSKVNVLESRLKDINKDCKIKVINDKLSPDNMSKFDLCGYDYIVDAIDMVTSKIALIDYAYHNEIKIISSMGAGNRIGIPECVVGDIFETKNDGLAKVLRNKFRKLGIEHHKVVYFKNKARPNGNIIGSIAYYPAIAGSMVASVVIDDLLKM